jgi:hypothetical protein
MSRQKQSSGDGADPYTRQPYLFWRKHPGRYTQLAIDYYEACYSRWVKNNRRSYLLNESLV